MAESRVANRMSQASTNSLPAPLTLHQSASKLPPDTLNPGHIDVGDEIIGVANLIQFNSYEKQKFVSGGL
jgi:hypothetical protein